MVAVGAIKNHSITTSFPSLLSSVTHRVHGKAVAVIAVVGLLFFTFVYYLLKSRVSSTPPSPATSPTPTARSLPVRDVRKKTCLSKIEKLLEPGQKLGTAIDSGDCFYDALAQTLQKAGIRVSREQLRQDVVQALEDPATAQKIQEHVERDPDCTLGFENYKKYVRYSEKELVPLRLSDPEAPPAPYWGAENREGLVLCAKYQFNLRIISAGMLDDSFKSDKLLLQYQKIREEFEKEGKITFVEHQDKQIQERLIVLSQNESQYYVGDTTYPSDAPYSKTCTLVLYEKHFIPVL